jgi:hypothetical protein
MAGFCYEPETAGYQPSGSHQRQSVISLPNLFGQPRQIVHTGDNTVSVGECVLERELELVRGVGAEVEW